MGMRRAGFRPVLLASLVASATLSAAAPPVGNPREPLEISRTGVRVTSASGRQAAPKIGFLCHADLTALPEFQNIYVLAVPFFDGLGDIANSTAPNPCDPSGVRDGVINADDLLCDLWTSREGAMSVSRRDEPSAAWQTRTALRDDTTRRIHFVGTWTEPLVPAEGFLVQVAGPNGGFMNNPAIIVGSHDPSYPGHVLLLPSSGGKQVSVINSPYHSMYGTADEILCGLEGMDWIEGPDGNPTTCPTRTGTFSGGIFDGISGAPMTIMYFDNVADGSGTDNQWVWRTVSKDVTGALVFEGTDFALRLALGCPTGYLATYGPPFLTSTFLSPHF